MDPVAELGAAVLAARKQRGWTQSVLAASAGVSRATVARIESGRDVSATSLGRLADALELRLQLVPSTTADPVPSAAIKD